MDEFLKTSYLKRLFFGVMVISFFVLLLLRFLLVPILEKQPLPTIQDVILAIVDNLLVAVVTTVVGAIVILWATPPIMHKSKLEIIDPVQIKQALAEAEQDTEFWWYRGNTARHLRSVTLPTLAKVAKNTNLSKDINILMLDPTNTIACENYATHRQRLRSAVKSEPWTVDRVRIELNATVIAAYYFKSQVPSLRITIGLLDKISIFRIDLASKLLVMTKEGREEPALRCDSGTFFYNSFREDFIVSLDQSKILPNQIKLNTPNKLQLGNVKQLLKDVGLDNQQLDDKDVRTIIDLVEKKENPYG
jgi:hypothetical protein